MCLPAAYRRKGGDAYDQNRMDRTDLEPAGRLLGRQRRLPQLLCDLTRWNVFDLDAYGSPWRLWWIIAKRRPVEPNERVAVVFTDGASLRARLGRVERHIAHLAGVPANLEKAASLWPTLVARAVRKLATMHNARLDRLHLASHRNMHYGAALLEGLRENAATASPEEAEEPAF